MNSTRPQSTLLSLLGFLSLLTVGCVEGDLVFWLNADGSGRVEIDVVMPAVKELEASGQSEDKKEGSIAVLG